MKTYREWEDREIAQLVELKKDSKNTWPIIAEEMQRTICSCQNAWNRIPSSDRRRFPEISQSPYPVYNQPLHMEGDALILTDVEAPFHHADFLNRCLDVSTAWGITQLISGGDLLHFDSISSWEPNWTAPQKQGLSDEQEKRLMEYAQKLPARRQGELMQLIVDIDGGCEADGPNLSEEMQAARKVIATFDTIFSVIHVVMGNHEGRLLRAMQTPLFPQDMLRLIDADNPKWMIAPFYFSCLVSGGVEWQIEHPRGATPSTAEKLASKYCMNTIMGHSHLLRFSWDISGKYYAIQSGCSVDELKMPYSSQRHNTAPAHALGAVIVRDGYPWLLHEGVDWKRLCAMK